MKLLWGWGCGCEGRKTSWVKWGNLCKQKDEGVLGTKDIENLNIALLAKSGAMEEGFRF